MNLESMYELDPVAADDALIEALIDGSVGSDDADPFVAGLAAVREHVAYDDADAVAPSAAPAVAPAARSTSRSRAGARRRVRPKKSKRAVAVTIGAGVLVTSGVGQAVAGNPAAPLLFVIDQGIHIGQRFADPNAGQSRNMKLDTGQDAERAEPDGAPPDTAGGGGEDSDSEHGHTKTQKHPAVGPGSTHPGSPSAPSWTPQDRTDDHQWTSPRGGYSNSAEESPRSESPSQQPSEDDRSPSDDPSDEQSPSDDPSDQESPSDEPSDDESPSDEPSDDESGTYSPSNSPSSEPSSEPSYSTTSSMPGGSDGRQYRERDGGANEYDGGRVARDEEDASGEASPSPRSADDG